jgi:hypothetical protein
MEKEKKEIDNKNKRRTYGAHLTSSDIFLKYIFPEITSKLNDYIWVDLYAGEGNLILPILDHIPQNERLKFFENQIFLFDIQPEMREKCIKNAKNYNIPRQIAENNIQLRNNLESFPKFLKNKHLPIFHITNPPYLYLGYIRKHNETQEYLSYFENENEGYQDLYQIAMMNDLRNKIENIIYIIPSNFLYGASVSNKFRLNFLKDYKILKMVIFETQIFEFTGTNICIGIFKRKQVSKSEPQSFTSLKVLKKNRITEREYNLIPKYKYRAGSEFEGFLEKYRARNPLNVNYYLLNEEVSKNPGTYQITVIDANKYENTQYRRLTIEINNQLKEKIEKNILYVRTVDTGSIHGRGGLGIIEEDFGVKGIFVSGNTYRTHPIQVFLEPKLSIEDQLLLHNYVNYILEYFRERLDSEFLTTYKYSKAEYTRKYLGLTQVRGLIETFPFEIEGDIKNELISSLKNNQMNKIVKLLKK